MFNDWELSHDNHFVVARLIDSEEKWKYTNVGG